MSKQKTSIRAAAALCTAAVLAACGTDPIPEPPTSRCGSLTEPVRALPMAEGTVDLAAGAIDIPDALDGNQPLTLALTAGPAEGMVEITGPITGPRPDGPWQRLGPLGPTGVQIAAPRAAGSHIIRIRDGDAVIAEGGLEVAAPTLRLCTVTEARLGEQIAIVWRGPGAPGDRLDIFDPVEEAVVTQQPALPSDKWLTSTRIRAPERAGVFRVRYMDARDTVLLERDLTVVPTRLAAVALLAPGAVTPDRKFQVVWTGAPLPGHVFRLYDTLSGVEIDRAVGEGDAEGPIEAVFRAPKTPDASGRYVVQYLDPADQTQIIQHTRALTFK